MKSLRSVILLSIADGIEWIVIWCGKLCSVITLLVALAITYEVVKRYFFDAPTIWVTESSVFGCAILYVIGAAWTAQEGRHVRIELVYGHLSLRGKAIADIIGFMFFALYMGMMLWAALPYAHRSWELRETTAGLWDPPIYPIKIVLAVGMALLLLQAIPKLIRDLHVVIRGQPA
jgi:TRAP-type mannitol/chloroaromatic compound transport system permease small subunit